MTAYAAGLIKKGEEKGEVRGIIKAIQKLIKANVSKETILSYGFSEEDYNEAEESFLQTVE